jgi:signal transduction histidine kinase
LSPLVATALRRAEPAAIVRAMSTPDPSTGRPSPLAALTARSVLITLLLAALVAVGLKPWFKTELAELMGRTAFIGAALLVMYSVVRSWPAAWLPRWLPRWLPPMMAVALTAPLATLIVYLVGVGGDLDQFLGTPGRVTGFALISTAAAVAGLWIAIVAALGERRDAAARARELEFRLEKSQLERQALDARLALLQAQIEPHFLFNTLANVQALVEARSPRAPEVLKSLIAYLRAALPRLHSEAPSLGDELQLVRAYLRLMQLRMPDRLAWSVEADSGVELFPLPPLTLLTLVENAVRHGIDPSEQGGRIDVSARRDPAGGLRLAVADSGVGMDPTADSGVGLANLRERLNAYFGGKAALQLSEVEPRGLRAEIVLPPRPAAPGSAPVPR